MARITKDELLKQINAFNNENPNEKIALRGLGGKAKFYQLAYNHARQKASRFIRKKYKDEFEEMLNKELLTCEEEKKALLIKEAKNGCEYSQKVLDEVSIDWQS